MCGRVVVTHLWTGSCLSLPRFPLGSSSRRRPDESDDSASWRSNESPGENDEESNSCYGVLCSEVPAEWKYNFRQMVGSWHRRTRELAKEVGTVDWSHRASDSDSGKATFLPWKVQEIQELMQDFENRTNWSTRRGRKFSNYRLMVLTDLTQQTLRTMRAKLSMRENLIENCRFGLPVI